MSVWECVADMEKDVDEIDFAGLNEEVGECECETIQLFLIGRSR